MSLQERLLALGQNARCAARAEYDNRMVNNAVLAFTPPSTTHRS
ncbi:hypothetical protein BZL30_1647 [Mycobacterium kansasii]|uniref:Uncharacterized protein n=1 Tax=Mycobacterium kansasii TaxID=1768 RepID=A0A1V3XGU2_MYCKA|nr:hypothetical protein BZL30_1647 [Mycobacterium kansasii]